MKSIRIGINGFGRIGRAAARIALERQGVELVAINSRSDAHSHAYLLKYDSIHGRFNHDIATKNDKLTVDGKPIACFRDNNPSEIPWDTANVDIVIEATGKFTTRADTQKHLGGSVSHVIVSSPSEDVDITVVLGVNEKSLDPQKHKIVSNASCTTNCLATVVKVLDDVFVIKRGSMTTCHSPTQTQKILDASEKKDKRRGRSAFLNIIPTSTGASKALGQVLPHLDGKITAVSLRVPNPTGSIIDLVVEVEKKADKILVNKAFRKACDGTMKGILKFSTDALVSQDIVTTPFSSIVVSDFTSVIDDTLVKVFAWYDNEWGYSTRLIDLVAYIAKQSS